MAETDEQNTSVALYNYMCQNIVGSEEHVKTIRMMNNVRDNLQSDNRCTLITSGSVGEGLKLRGSDLDLMKVIKYTKVCEDTNVYFEKTTTYFIVETEDTQPGYTQLRLVYTNNQQNLNDCEKVENDYYYSSFSVKQQCASLNFPTVHGPCLTNKSESCDIAFSLHSKYWIKTANKWITRSNNSWPGSDVKQSIVAHGVLFVPIGVKGSTKEELEWRISFSVGEKLLIYTFTHTQLICYALMKILLKDVIALDLDCKELLCSYFIKTVMFWISEEEALCIWKPKNLMSCFMRCFRRLLYCVEYNVCPHYFIPENNLFENKIKGNAQAILLNKLNFLNSYGWKCLLLSDQISNFDAFAYDVTEDPSDTHVRSVKAVFQSIIFLGDHIPWTSTMILEKVIHKIFSMKSSKIKHMYIYYMSKLNKYGQFVSFDDKTCNKSRYTQYNTYLRTLLLSTNHDAVSGWVVLASFFYKTKQYCKALHILHYSLFKCTPEKFSLPMNLSQLHKKLANLYVYKRITNVQIRKILLQECVALDKNAVFLPDEIHLEAGMVQTVENSVDYGYLIRVFCHYRLCLEHHGIDSNHRNAHTNFTLTCINNL